MIVRNFRYVVCAAGLLVSLAFGQYPFSDDFSNFVQTNSNWLQMPADSVNRVCAGGVYTVTNQHMGYAALVYHTFATKTPTFTASCVIKRSSAAVAAGMWLCLSLSGTPAGYAVQLYNSGDPAVGYITIRKYATAGSGQILGVEYHFQNLSDTLMVSKQGSTLFVFCNGVFLDSVTDNTNPIASGDFGLMVPPNSQVTFDDVLFTNQFTPGSFPTRFIDSFDNSSMGKYWIMRPSQYLAEDTVLKMTVPPAAGAFCDVRMTLDTLAARLVVSWRSGDSIPFYGLYLYGPPDTSSGTFPMVFFGIDGSRVGKAFMLAASASPSQYIRGKAIWTGSDSVFFKDTIDVFRTTGSNYYFMNVNGYRIDSLATASVTFPIYGAGIFCWGSTTGGQIVYVDYFRVGPDSNSTPVVYIAKGTRTLKNIRFAPLTSRYLFDPLGRKVGIRDASGRLTGKVLAPGCYIMKEGKSGVIIKK
jgi:hypothetical protein